MPRKRASSPRRKRKPRDLNREVANALGAATGTAIPKGEDLLGSAEALAELAKAKKAPSR